MYHKSIQELEEETREKIVIDLRSREEYEKETYPEALHIFWEDFQIERFDSDKTKPVYLICYTGQKSDEIAEKLNEAGYEAYSIEGGYRSYLRLKLQKLMEQPEEKKEKYKDVERSIIKKYRKEICRLAAMAF